jgi:predicted nucleic acid-binding protein
VNTIYLDSVGLLALWDQRDQWHVAAKACLAARDPDTTRYVTTSYVLLECANHAARRVYRAEVVRMREELGMAGDLYDPLPEEVHSAWDDYARGIAGTASLVDLVSFAVMRRLGIAQAFTNDKHFAAAGFKVLF